MATYYVSKSDGDNSNPGTEALPFKTVERAISVKQLQDNIIIIPDVAYKGLLPNLLSGLLFGLNLPQELPFFLFEKFESAETFEVSLTIPEGYSVLTGGSFWNNNPGLGATNTQFQVNLIRDGVTYTNGVTSAAQAANTAGTFTLPSLVLIPNDKLQVVVVQGSPSWLGSGSHWRMLHTSHPYKPFGVPINLGNTVLYTCPAGKTAYTLSGTQFINMSGSTGRYKLYIVPEGETPDNTNLIAQRDVTGATFATLTTQERYIAAGESLVVSTDRNHALQMVITGVLELSE